MRNLLKTVGLHDEEYYCDLEGFEITDEDEKVIEKMMQNPMVEMETPSYLN